MIYKYFSIFVSTLFIVTIISSSSFAIDQLKLSKNENSLDYLDWNVFYTEYFESNLDDWETGSFNGPDLWHTTTFDAWSGDSSFACFDADFKHYVNDMDFNWALLSMVLDVEDEIEMVMDFYYKYITEDIDDSWGICVYDPHTELFIPFTYDDLPYETYGFHPDWTGPMQPMGEYQSFDILAAYEYGYNIGLFRDSNGTQTYELQIGFMFYKSDASGFTNAQAEANDIYWSGVMIDDVEIRRLVFNQEPQTPSEPSGPTDLVTDVSYDFTAVTSDPDGDEIRYGWDWDGDDVIDYMSDFEASGEPITVSHAYESEGTYNIQVKVEDNKGASSDFSEPLIVVVSENSPPNKPTITGPTNGKVGENYEYVISAVDPDGDDVFFEIEWFYDCPDIFWDGPYESGEQVVKTNAWEDVGEHRILVNVKDIHDLHGESAMLEVYMPKHKTVNPLLRLYEKIMIFPPWLTNYFFRT